MRWPEALRDRNFRLLYMGQAVSLLGDGMVGVALAFGVLEISDSPSSLGIVLWESTLQAEIPAESLSRVSAYDWLGSLAFNPVGAALVGPVAAGIGVETTLLACAALMTLVSVWVLTLPGVRGMGGVRVAAQGCLGRRW